MSTSLLGFTELSYQEQQTIDGGFAVVVGGLLVLAGLAVIGYGIYKESQGNSDSGATVTDSVYGY